MNIKLEKLSEANFADYEDLTKCDSGGGCYCGFWYQKFSSIAEWDQKKKENPLANRDVVKSRMTSGFHVGVVAYLNNTVFAWVSVSPLPEVFWAWRRVAQLGERAKDVAAITCITISPKFRSQGLQAALLSELKKYGASVGWKEIEGYPFDETAYVKHGHDLAWPGNTTCLAKSCQLA